MARWVTAVLLLSVAAATVHTAFTSASPYDEAVYRGISRNILRTGLPIRDSAAGTVFANSPPLGLYANAAILLRRRERIPRLACAALFLAIALGLARSPFLAVTGPEFTGVLQSSYSRSFTAADGTEVWIPQTR